MNRSKTLFFQHSLLKHSGLLGLLCLGLEIAFIGSKENITIKICLQYVVYLYATNRNLHYQIKLNNFH